MSVRAVGAGPGGGCGLLADVLDGGGCLLLGDPSLLAAAQDASAALAVAGLPVALGPAVAGSDGGPVTVVDTTGAYAA